MDELKQWLRAEIKQIVNQAWEENTNKAFDAISKSKIVDIAVQAGIMTFRNLKKDEKISRHDKRLQNTRLLLRNYKVFKMHCNESLFKYKIGNSNVIDILDSLDELSEERYIESIKRSTERTMTIVAHVEKMVDQYKRIAETSAKKNDLEKYKIIQLRYFDDPQKTTEEIAEILNVVPKTVYFWEKEAIESLSGLIFGIDSFRI
jgi:DNA-binding XRE family transcriptional regulator